LNIECGGAELQEVENTKRFMRKNKQKKPHHASVESTSELKSSSTQAS